MLGLLMLVPVVTSLALGLLYLFMGEGGPGIKAVGCVLFFAAVLLQFRSPYPLAGLILQVGVAVTLAVWRRLDTSV